MAYLIFLKPKNDEVRIKGIGCTDGKNQRNWISKEDTSSPTVSTKSLMLSCMIDEMEGQDVGTADITGAFLQTDYNIGDIHIKMEVEIVTILKETDPAYYMEFIYIDRLGNK